VARNYEFILLEERSIHSILFIHGIGTRTAEIRGFEEGGG
jgi:hypothetical protein